MPRTKVTSTSRDAITDDGNVLISYIDGEQLELDFTAGWLSSLDGVQIRCQVLEAVNDASGSRPTQIQTDGVRRTLEIRNSDGTAVTGSSYNQVVGFNNQVITARVDENRVNGLFVNNLTEDLAHEYFVPGSVIRSVAADGTDGASNNTIQTFDGINLNTGIATVTLTSAPAGIALATQTPRALLLPTHHQLSSTGNQFRVVLPDDLLTATTTATGTTPGTRSWTQRPTPGNAVYGFIGLEIREAVSTGQVQQIWRPMRGQVEVLYSVLSNT